MKSLLNHSKSFVHIFWYFTLDLKFVVYRDMNVYSVHLVYQISLYITYRFVRSYGCASLISFFQSLISLYLVLISVCDSLFLSIYDIV